MREISHDYVHRRHEILKFFLELEILEFEVFLHFQKWLETLQILSLEIIRLHVHHQNIGDNALKEEQLLLDLISHIILKLQILK